LKKKSSAIHLPGSKVIQALTGLESVDANYDVIMKADADLIFPLNYLETINKHFQSDVHWYGRWILLYRKNGGGFLKT
jgi:hypothetical protein